MINYRPTSLEDFDKIELRKEYENEQTIRRRMKASFASGCPGYSFVDSNGNIVAILSGSFVWAGVFSCCALVSEKIKINPIAMTKAVRQVLEYFRRMNDLHRVQITVRDDFREAQKWAHFLGFHYEGTLFGFGQDKSDYLMFARYF